VRWRRWLYFAGAVLAVRALNPASIAVVEGHSMEPTLRNGQLFVVDRLRYRLAPVSRGDVIAFRHGHDIYVKRVVALGGETVWLLVRPATQSVELIEPPLVRPLRRATARHPSLGYLERQVVPQGHVFVVGDHRRVSYDSRDFGPVPLAAVIGRAYW